MPDSSRTAARDLFKQAAEAGVAPLLLGGSPWAIMPDLLPRLVDAARLPTIAGFTTRAAAPTAQPVTAGVAVIPLTGIITPQGSFLSFLFGGAPGGLQAFREAFAEALGSPDVSAIVIDVDSPGGLVDLVPETAAIIRAARGSKPIVATADTKMLSAAYWIASQADEVVITPSGYAGSVGVLRVHEDWSKANSEDGLQVTYVHAGKYKVEGNSNEPLEAEAREQWQSDVDDVYGQFVADVAAGRGVSEQTVLADFGEGRTLNARNALAGGLVDRIDTYETVIKELLGTTGSSSSTSARADELAAQAEAAEVQRIADEAAADADSASEAPVAVSDEDYAEARRQLVAAALKPVAG